MYLKALSPLVGFELVVDEHGICVLEVSPEISIQLEAGKDGSLYILSIFDEVGHGKLRSNLLEAALIYNGLCQQCHLAWNKASSSLVLQDILAAGSSEEQVSDALVATINAAAEWHEAIKRGGNWPSATN